MSLIAQISALATRVATEFKSVRASIPGALLGTSTTSKAIASSGSISITVTTGMSLAVGSRVRVASTATPTTYMEGTVTAYNTSTGALVFTADKSSGSGTLASWTIIAQQGVAGTNGSTPVIKSTTATSLTVASSGSITFTTAASLGLAVGNYLMVASTANPTTVWMYGQISAISGTSVTITVLASLGSGTLTAWTVAEAGPQGPAGSQGAAGPGVGVIPQTGNLNTFLTPGLFDIQFDDTALPSWTVGVQFPSGVPTEFGTDGGNNVLLNAQILVVTQDGYTAQILTYYINPGIQKMFMRSYSGGAWTATWERIFVNMTVQPVDDLNGYKTTGLYILNVSKDGVSPTNTPTDLAGSTGVQLQVVTYDWYTGSVYIHETDQTVTLPGTNAIWTRQFNNDPAGLNSTWSAWTKVDTVLATPQTILPTADLNDYQGASIGIYNIDFDDSALPTWTAGTHYPSTPPGEFVTDGLAGKVLCSTMVVTYQDGYTAQVLTYYINTGAQKNFFRSFNGSWAGWIKVFDSSQGLPDPTGESDGTVLSILDGDAGTVEWRRVSEVPEPSGHDGRVLTENSGLTQWSDPPARIYSGTEADGSSSSITISGLTYGVSNRLFIMDDTVGDLTFGNFDDTYFDLSDNSGNTVIVTVVNVGSSPRPILNSTSAPATIFQPADTTLAIQPGGTLYAVYAETHSGDWVWMFTGDLVTTGGGSGGTVLTQLDAVETVPSGTPAGLIVRIAS